MPRRIGAVRMVQDLFMTGCRPLSLCGIRRAIPSLKSSQISMALCYLMRRQKLERESISNPVEKARKSVWLYTYKGGTNAS